MARRIKDQNYYVTNGWMINQLGLSGRELQVYAIIYGFTQDGETEFNGSLNYIMEWLGTSSYHTVIRTLNALIAKQLIVKRQTEINGVKTNYYKAVFPPPFPQNLGTAEMTEGTAKTAEGYCQNGREGTAKTAEGGTAKTADNIYINKDIYKDIDINNKSTGDGKPPEKKFCTPYEHIRKYYNDICHSFPKCISLSDKRKKAIDARWKEYGQDLQVFAKLFTLAEESDFLKGKNDRNWSATFDWMLNQNNMVKVLEGKYRNKGGAGNVGTKPLTTAELEAKLRASGQLKEAPDWMQ